MDSEEEPDYMADSFLESICGKDDIRPGLIKGRPQQYDHKRAVKKMEADERNRVRNPSMKEKESASREGGLNKPLDSNNIGFKMLQKLGFNPGSGLGKSGEGRVDPIPVEVKSNRQGLGQKSLLKARSKARAEARIENFNDYKERKAKEAAERTAKFDLSKCQRVCWELDSKERIENPEESWFWPDSKLPIESEEDEEIEPQLNKIEEEEEECQPASSDTVEESESVDVVEDDEYVELEEEFSVEEKVEMLTSYLRRTHLYCVWCGHSFDDEKDLQQECPGPGKEDH